MKRRYREGQEHVSVYVSTKLKERMDTLGEVNWSAVVRRLIEAYVANAELKERTLLSLIQRVGDLEKEVFRDEQMDNYKKSHKEQE